MRSKCSNTFKALTALVLAVLLLFGTMATPISAVVKDNFTNTGANADLAQTGAISGIKLAGTFNGWTPTAAVASFPASFDINIISTTKIEFKVIFEENGTNYWCALNYASNGNSNTYTLGNTSKLDWGDNNTNNIEWTPATTGYYTFTVSNSGENNYIHVEKKKLATPSLKYNNSTSSPISVSASSVELTWADISNAASYTIFKNGASFATNVTSPYTVTEAGTYTVKAISSGAYVDSDASNQIQFKKSTTIYLSDKVSNFSKAYIYRSEEDKYNNWPGDALVDASIDGYNKKITFDKANWDDFYLILTYDSGNSKTLDMSTPCATGATYYIDEASTSAAASLSTDPTFNVNLGSVTNGTIDASPKRAASDNTITLTSSPSSGYHFGSWTVKGSDESTITVTNNQFTMPAKNVTVTATFIGDPFTVTFNTNDASVSNATPVAGSTSATATYGTAMPSITLPTCTGYTFQGYFDAADGGKQYYDSNGDSANAWDKTSDTILYAHWSIISYNIQYHHNTADASVATYAITGSLPADSTKDHYDTVSVSATVLTRPGYTHDGWATSSGGAKVYELGGSYSGNADLDLYPHWVADTPESDYVVKEGMSFYLINNDTGTFVADNDTQKPKFYFSTDGSASVAATSYGMISGLTNKYFGNVPSGGPYRYVKVTNSAGTIDSGWIPLSGFAKNTLTFSGAKFTAFGVSTETFDNGIAHIYFDNTNTNWDLTGSNKLWLVLGNSTSQQALQMTKVNNTAQLYYVAPNTDVNGVATTPDFNYSFFYFAVAASDVFTGRAYATAQTTTKTSFASLYDASNDNNTSGGTAVKSFIGMGLTATAISALDMLWITDNGVSSSSNSHQNEYLNRPVYLKIENRGSACISGYQFTSTGLGGVTAYPAAGASQIRVSYDTNGSSSEPSVAYFARSTTITVENITPAQGYKLKTITISDGVNSYLSYTGTDLSAKTSTALRGGSDSVGGGCPSITVTVTFVKDESEGAYTDVKLMGLYNYDAGEGGRYDSDADKNLDRVMNYSKLDVDGNGTNDFNDKKVYWLYVSLESNYEYKKDNGQAGFMIYDTDAQAWYGCLSTLSSSDTDEYMYTGSTRCGIQAANTGGKNANYLFVFDPNVKNEEAACKGKVTVYYPNEVTFDDNDDHFAFTYAETITVPESQWVGFGQTATYVAASDGERNAFGGWYTHATNNTKFSFDTKIYATTPLYAHWIEKKELTFATGAPATNYTSTNGNTATTLYIKPGEKVTVRFEKLSADMGISAATFTSGGAAYELAYTIEGHTLTFTMPEVDVQVATIATEPFNAEIIVSNSTSVDVEGITSTGYYAKGSSVGTIKIRGAKGYAGNYVLTSLNAYYGNHDVVLAAPLTSTNTTATLTNDGSRLTFTWVSDPTNGDDYVQITGNIGGYLTVVPVCTVEYTIHLTSKVISDTIGEAKTIKSTPLDGTAPIGAFTGSGFDSGSDSIEAEKFNPDEDGDIINTFERGSSLTFTVTPGVDAGKYTFLGWYTGDSSGPDTSKVALGDLASLTIDPLSESMYIYAVYTRDIYLNGKNEITGSGSDWKADSNVKMNFDAKKQLYYWECNSNLTAGTGYNFRIIDEATGWGYTAWNKTGIDGTDYGARITGGSKSDGSNRADATLTLSSSSNYGNNVTIYYNPSKKQIYALPTYSAHYIYLSDGFVAGLNNMDSIAEHKHDFTSTSAYSAYTGATTSDTTLNQYAGSGTSGEKYHLLTYTGTISTLTFTTTLGGTTPANIKVTKFVVYDLKSGECTAIDYSSASSNVYTASLTSVSSDLYICPVIDFTDTYLTANKAKVKATDVFVDTTDIDTSLYGWGGLFSIFTFKTTPSVAPNGAWPGSLMYPSGAKRYTAKAYESVANKNDGIIFSNFNIDSGNVTVIGKFSNRYFYPDKSQTYDYYEPVALASDDSILTFGMKKNNDGYHGHHYQNGTSVYRIQDSQAVLGTEFTYHDNSNNVDYDLFNTYTFEYLTTEDGTSRLNLYGEEVGSAAAGFYVVCMGDVAYSAGGYVPDSTYSGSYSVEWYIYDARGVFLGHTLSASLYKKNGSSDVPYVIELLQANDLANNNITISSSDYSDKSIMISYEAPNTYNNSTRYSGQWYTQPKNQFITNYVAVGMTDGNGTYYVPPTMTSATSYGTAEFNIDSCTNASKGQRGDLWWAQVTVSDVSAKNMTITAATSVGGSVFKGWYTYNKIKDEYVFYNENETCTPDITTGTYYYAMYEPTVVYNYVYTGRQGDRRTVTANGATINPSWGGESSGTVDKSNEDRQADISTVFASIVGTFSIFHKNISVTPSDPSTVTVDGVSVTIQCTVTPATGSLTVYGPDGLIKGTLASISYGTSVDFSLTGNTFKSFYDDTIAPAKAAGNFVGWYQYDPGTDTVGELVSSSSRFGLLYTYDTLTVIGIVKGGTKSAPNLSGSPLWIPHIDENVTSREGDTRYTDFAVRFNHATRGTMIRSLDDLGYKYGVIILMANNSGNLDGNSTPDTYDTLQNIIEGNTGDEDQTKKYTATARTQMANLDGGNVKSYKLGSLTNTTRMVIMSGSGISNYNRLDMALKLDKTKSDYYTYYAAAYMVDNSGNYYFSEIVDNLP